MLRYCNDTVKDRAAGVNQWYAKKQNIFKERSESILVHLQRGVIFF